jgi:hypothetical protein
LGRAAAISGRADYVAVTEVPEIRFAHTPGGRIAYQVVGDGPIDVLVTHGAIFPIDLMWDEPGLVRFLDGLSSFSRHVWFDARPQRPPRTRTPGGLCNSVPPTGCRATLARLARAATGIAQMAGWVDSRRDPR